MIKEHNKRKQMETINMFLRGCSEHRRRRRRRRRRAYAPTSNTASDDNHEQIHSRVSFSFLYGYGAPLQRVQFQFSCKISVQFSATGVVQVSFV